MKIFKFNQKSVFFREPSGFTLVESLVAITVLLIGVLGPLVLATRSISEGVSTKNKITASYLTQEAVELVKGRRDLNVKKSDNWDYGLSGCNSSPGCYVNDASINDITIAACPHALCQVMLPPSGGVIFNREVIININANIAEVTVTVTWSEKGLAQKPYVLKTYLFPKS